MDNAVWIVIAVIVALLLIGAIIMVGRKQRTTRHRAEAEEIRERLRHEDAEVRHGESIAAETEARARAAQAEAERSYNAAQSHRSEVITSREQLEQHRRHADSLDPRGAEHRDREERVRQGAEVRREGRS